MSWIILLIAGLFEIVWVVGLKASGGFTRSWPSARTLAAMLVSFLLLSQALKTLPVGTAYAVWTGIGTAGAAIYGMIYFGEPREAWRMACIVLILTGIAGLRFGAR